VTVEKINSNSNPNKTDIQDDSQLLLSTAAAHQQGNSHKHHKRPIMLSLRMTEVNSNTIVHTLKIALNVFFS
jgi:hypothetical protein